MIEVIDYSLKVFLYLLLISIVFIPLELSFKQKEVKFFRKEWLIDIFFYFGQVLVWNFVTVYVLNFLFSKMDFLWIKKFHAIVKEFPAYMQIIFVILLSDFLIYWGHRFQHRFDFLWNFHRVHHTAETVDFIAAFREHPLDNIYTRGIETLPAILLGFDLNLIAGFLTFRGLWALFIHSNVNLRLGFLEILLGSPHLHHWHHELEHEGKCNYANLSPLMDILFGTYYSPKAAPISFGIVDEMSHSYLNQIIEPMIPKAIRNRMKRVKG
ncbi:MAG: sterol desaturase family protein [Leptospiraceae bacterium]|nr:sterol desaturase family protein [Leptospiraceae bacterium]